MLNACAYTQMRCQSGIVSTELTERGLYDPELISHVLHLLIFAAGGEKSHIQLRHTSEKFAHELSIDCFSRHVANFDS